MSDELPTAARVSDPGIRALYRLEHRWQAWLDVEAALAKAQEELGIIPTGAAEAIGRAARLELLDRARIDEGFARTGHTIVPLVWELSRVTGEPHGGWVHWGATTQNNRRLAGTAPGAPDLIGVDRSGAIGDGRSRRARR
jgi:3-carboxy-cis,cis-muconate cycloisomerase